jgi:hypothetical protein
MKSKALAKIVQLLCKCIAVFCFFEGRCCSACENVDKFTFGYLHFIFRQ